MRRGGETEAMGARLEMAVACDLDALAATQAELAAFAEAHRLPPRICRALELVAEEAISNIVRHGFGDSADDARIDCVVEATPERVAIVFIDNGPAFDPLAEAPPPALDASVEARAVGGLGVHLIKATTDDCRYVRADGLNRLEASWRIARQPDAS